MSNVDSGIDLIACRGDRVLCALDGRCAACTIARLRERERLLERENSRLRHEVMALEWGLDQIYRHVLRTDADLGIASFAHAVRTDRDVNPKHLECLHGEDVSAAGAEEE